MLPAGSPSFCLFVLLFHSFFFFFFFFLQNSHYLHNQWYDGLRYIFVQTASIFIIYTPIHILLKSYPFDHVCPKRGSRALTWISWSCLIETCTNDSRPYSKMVSEAYNCFSQKKDHCLYKQWFDEADILQIMHAQIGVRDLAFGMTRNHQWFLLWGQCVNPNQILSVISRVQREWILVPFFFSSWLFRIATETVNSV